MRSTAFLVFKKPNVAQNLLLARLYKTFFGIGTDGLMPILEMREEKEGLSIHVFKSLGLTLKVERRAARS